jgi:hypothetical protein
MLHSDGLVCTAGPGWAADRAKRAEITAIAVERVAKAAFVGVQAEWAMSMCVFVTKFRRRNGEPYDLSPLFRNTRPSTAHRCEVGARTALLGESYRDPADWAVFLAAQERLKTDAAAVAADPVYKACMAESKRVL